MSYFDSKYYYNKYEDIRNAKLETPDRLLNHWIKFGFYENRICNIIFENLNLKLLKLKLKKKNIVYYQKLFNNLYENYKIKPFEITNEYIINMNVNLDDKLINMYKLTYLDENKLEIINKNIDNFLNKISCYKNILFICGDYPSYGGAATNCNEIQTFLSSKNFNVFGLYYLYEPNNNIKKTYDNYKIVDINKLEEAITNLPFKPQLIILKSPCPIDLKFLKCPVYFLIGGIFTNQLNDYYYNINVSLNCKYINKHVIKQIEKCDISFSNSSHTKELLMKFFNINTEILYTTFIPFYRKSLFIDNYFINRKYDYGLIVSNFDTRNIKNIEESINFLKDKKNVILIGQNSSKYKELGFKCVELVNYNEMQDYYKQIKYIVQDSFYESCSNVKVEGLFNGCKICPVFVVSSTQYPGYGGSATNAYKIIQILRNKGFKAAGLFFHDKINVNYDPSNMGGIFIYDMNNRDNVKIKKDILKYLKTDVTHCLAKNYLAPLYCKEIFDCYTVYLVSGISLFQMCYKDKSAADILNDDFKINVINKEETDCNNKVDSIVCNSELTKKLFLKLYPTFSNKIFKYVIDTSYINTSYLEYNNINVDKTFDILICASNLDREQKNNYFLLTFLNNKIFDNYKKCIIGKNNNKFKNIKNATFYELLIPTECYNTIAKCKVLLFPSLFDSNPNTVREALAVKCLPLITHNIGFAENFPKEFICDSFNSIEWEQKLLYLLNNYDNLKNIEIKFSSITDLEIII